MSGDQAINIGAAKDAWSTSLIACSELSMNFNITLHTSHESPKLLSLILTMARRIKDDRRNLTRR